MRILLVAYFFPPTRDTGAQRPTAMAKYLVRLGHEVTVLTTGAFGTGGEPGDVEVIRAADAQALRARRSEAGRVRSLFESDTYAGKPHPISRLTVPEPLVAAWAPFARRAAIAAHRKRPFDAILTTSPPESAHLVGLALKRRGVPWIADVRDAWTFEPLRPRFPLAAQRRLDAALERRWLGAADRIVCVSKPAAGDLVERGIATAARVSVITNAWDPDGDPSAAAVAEAGAAFDPDRVSLLYTGRFGSYGRDPTAFAEALGRLGSERLEVAIAGPLTPAERELFAAVPGPSRPVLLGSVERDRALALQRAADALLLIAQPARSQLLNFKLFEYLAAERPILPLCAGTEAGRIVEELGAGPAIPAGDPGAICAALERLLAGELPTPDREAARAYRYPAAAEAMAEVISSAAG